jgi:hypothetical protein
MSLFCLIERVIKFLSLTLGIKSIMENTNEHQVNIELDETTALGVYSNLAIITHSPAEMVCDFVQLMPGMPKGKVRSRVIMTPQNAKRFMRALIENVQKYEQHFGVIEDNETPPMPPMNFGNPSTLA